MNLHRQLDILCRLQVLEGAAGLPFGTWSKQGERALKRAQAFFTDAKKRIRADWFSTEDTEVYTTALRYVKSKFGEQTQGDIAAEDIMQRAMTGLSTSAEDQLIPLFHAVGCRGLSLLDNGTSPKSFFFLATHLMLARRVYDAIKVNRHLAALPKTCPDSFKDSSELVSDIRMTTLLRDRARLEEAIDFLSENKHRALRLILTDYLSRDMPIKEELMTNTDAADYFGVTKQTIGAQIKDSWRALAVLMDTWPMADQTPHSPCCI